jgi:hemoglobin
MNATIPITEQEIALLVDSFYAKVRVDPEINPVFNDVVQNWDAHLSLLKDFWSTVLLTTSRYKGNPLLAHFRLPIQGRYFARWLALFSETANEVMTAPRAEVVTQKAKPNRHEHSTRSRFPNKHSSVIDTALATKRKLPETISTRKERCL